MDYYDACLDFCPVPISACSGTAYREILVRSEKIFLSLEENAMVGRDSREAISPVVWGELVTPPHPCYTCLGSYLS
jgi:hypothetical protein